MVNHVIEVVQRRANSNINGSDFLIFITTFETWRLNYLSVSISLNWAIKHITTLLLWHNCFTKPESLLSFHHGQSTSSIRVWPSQQGKTPWWPHTLEPYLQWLLDLLKIIHPYPYLHTTPKITCSSKLWTSSFKVTLIFTLLSWRTSWTS